GAGAAVMMERGVGWAELDDAVGFSIFKFDAQLCHERCLRLCILMRIGKPRYLCPLDTITALAFSPYFRHHCEQADPRRRGLTMATLTKRQKQLVDYLDNYINEHGYAPTLAEVGEFFGLSSLATVHKHLRNLETKGYIKRQHNHSRAL